MFNENDKTTIKKEFKKLIEITSESNKNISQTIESRIKNNAKLKYLYENADWNNLKLFEDEKTSEGYVLILNDNKFFNNSYHGQRAIVFKEINSEYIFNVIEIVSKTILDSTNADIIEKSIINVLSGSSIQVSSDKFYILCYDANYNIINTYTNENNKWVKSNVVITNNLVPKLKNALSSLNTVAADPNCETWYTILYWYDLQTGIILGYTIISITNSCDENYTGNGVFGSYSSQPIDTDCINSSTTLANNFINSVTSSNELISETTLLESTERIERLLKWKCANTNVGGIYSYEKGTVKIIPNTSPDKKYEWDNIEHQSVAFENLISIGSYTVTTLNSTFNIGKYNASLQLSINLKYQSSCLGIPVSAEKSITSTKFFNVNSSTSVE